MRYVVTGGAGFIGSHIAEALVEKGEEVVVIDNFYTGKEENIACFRKKITLVRASITDKKAMHNTLKKDDVIFHEAALRSVPVSFQHPKEYHDVNINGMWTLLEAARKKEVDRIIFASSSSVYGDAEVFPQKETFCPDPKSPYAITKYVGEKYLKLFYEMYGLKTMSLRYFNVFGPRQDPHSQYSAVIPLFIEKVLKNESPIIHWDGEQSRDFSYVKNVVHANLLAAKAKKGFGDVFNISEGKTVTINRLLAEINKILGKNIKANVTGKQREGDIRKSEGDPGKAGKAWGYQSPYTFEQGLKETIAWYKAQHG